MKVESQLHFKKRREMPSVFHIDLFFVGEQLFEFFGVCVFLFCWFFFFDRFMVCMN